MDTAHTLQQILHQPPGEKRVLGLLPAIAAGLAVFVVMCAVSVGLGFLSYGLGMGALAALALAGLSLGYRAGILSILGATFAALLPAALAVGGADDFKTSRRTTVAEVSVAEAPRHGDAEVLIFTDARVATEFTHAWISPPAGRGPEVHHATAPLVPPGWQPGMPVPAWRVCSGGDADWCRKALAYPVRAAQRLGAADAARYQPEVAAAARRFGLASAAGAPLLHLTTPPAERAEGAVAGMIFMPTLGFVVWLFGLLLWRGVRRLRNAVAG
jgi:hypothetical protein